MKLDASSLTLSLANTEDDLRAAQRLRYQVFIRELGGDGQGVDHENHLERDHFDPVFDHLLLIDESRNRAALDHVVGVYRLLPGERAAEHGAFYSENEYDLSVLKASGRKLLELGRSCVHRDYRSGLALHMLWSGLADYVRTRDIEILFGVASLHGTDVENHAMALSHLHHAYLAPSELRPRALDGVYLAMDALSIDQIDRVAAMKAMPALIKAYLRAGGCVGDGAFVDHAFNTTDVCMIMDTSKLSASVAARFGAPA